MPRSGLRSNPPDMSLEAPMKFVTATPEGSLKLAVVQLQEDKQLLAMDRYERRAVSRREFAMRAFDETRRQCGNCDN